MNERDYIEPVGYYVLLVGAITLISSVAITSLVAFSIQFVWAEFLPGHISFVPAFLLASLTLVLLLIAGIQYDEKVARKNDFFGE